MNIGSVNVFHIESLLPHMLYNFKKYVRFHVLKNYRRNMSLNCITSTVYLQCQPQLFKWT